jgi:hypothetical protein
VEFNFAAAMRGRGAHALDLILLVDTSTGGKEDTSGIRVRERIEALSNALDVTQSRLVLTTILAGAELRSEDGDYLSNICRVLPVRDIRINKDGMPVDEVASLRLDDAIRVLLPLELQPFDDAEASENHNVIKELRSSLPDQIDAQLVRELMSASISGESAVERALARRVESALEAAPSQ